MKKTGIGGFSSMLVSLPGLIVFLCLSILNSVIGAPLLAGFCLFVFLLCGSSRLWGALAVKNVSVSICASDSYMFIEDKTDVSFQVKNGKILPIIWLELLLPMPRRGCIMPEGEFEESSVAIQEEDQWEGRTALKRKFALIMREGEFRWNCTWKAKGRGVYRLDRLVLRSGDGFGLTQSQTVTTPVNEPIFVVYPRILPVDITPFLTTQWDGSGASGGFMDDLTVMRGMRRYETGDSWKHINWRMASRGQDINVNLYDAITPKAIHFAVDGESFCSGSGSGEEFEEALSILASIMLRLSETGVLCGLSLPRSKYLPQTDMPAKETDVYELLAAVAGYDLLDEKDEELSAAEKRAVFSPSDFDLVSLSLAAYSSGRLYYIVCDAAALRFRPIPQTIDLSKTVLLTYHEPTEEDETALGMRIIRLKSFMR